MRGAHSTRNFPHVNRTVLLATNAHLLPNARAWRLAENTTLAKFFRGLEPLGVCVTTFTFRSNDIWYSVTIDPGRPNRRVWIVCDMPESTSNSTVYFRQTGQQIGPRPEYVLGRVVGNSSGSLLSVPALLDCNGAMQVQSTHSGIYIRLTQGGSGGRCSFLSSFVEISYTK